MMGVLSGWLPPSQVFCASPRAAIRATFGYAATKSGPRAGAYFANRGGGLTLLAGQPVLIETFALGDAATVHFSW